MMMIVMSMIMMTMMIMMIMNCSAFSFVDKRALVIFSGRNFCFRKNL